jgi:hypothetical protein
LQSQARTHAIPDGDAAPDRCSNPCAVAAAPPPYAAGNRGRLAVAWIAVAVTVAGFDECR